MSEAAARLPGLIVNIDDLGMCHGANVAFLELFARGRCDSGSVMVPCPWFLEIAEAGAADPALKLGVHVTLTAEKAHYRWRPLTAPPKSSGLVDDDGYFHGDPQTVRRRAVPEAVEAEMRAQIEMFLRHGLKPTHFDPHQDTVLAPEFFPIYVALGREYGVPVLFPRNLASHDSIDGIGPVDEAAYIAAALELEASGEPVADSIRETPWHRDQPAEARYRALFADIGPGLTFMAMHANAPGEIEAIEPRSAAIRTEEYDVLRAEGPIDWIDGLKVRRGTLTDFRTVSP
ncbi:polysaccharide deacetylase family protein [Kaistia dalseonensis]|uniref:Glycoside hydrolase/deacetylase ChbG (UPF0249 family) n=1 Tax=Kaistia dalseonensis TaxID=410840 RepID=A0ABU0H3W7_9HYPH|nr:polysaccharide deacetylase family protein [Kaistia dalseonensis]MCX5494420.1 polysaccharide deacetylase family protein [Kaistia dalseonensis]MDQ0436999.1 putative glycoside hydrolase/deacetylase ChbG (UPF0249 family) [Kaistia dalseonensis]